MDSSIAVYAVVFSAIVLPVALWRRGDGGAAVVVHADGRWNNLPGMFKRLWPLALALEDSVGAAVAATFGGGRDEFEKLRLASGLPLTYARMGVLKVLCAMICCALGAIFLAMPGMKTAYGASAALGGLVFGWFYPGMALSRYVEWRKSELVRGLPFAIDLMGSAMRAGLEFGAAMRYFVGLGTGGPIQEEFGTVLQQIELGKTRTEALSEMASRVQVEAFTAFVGVIAYGTEIGASIVDTLKIHGEDLRRARFHVAERKAARAPSLMILPMVLFIMPAVFIIIITPVIMQMRASGIGGH